MRLVLAHGIFGFGTDKINFGINYFNGVRSIFEDAGFDVFEPTVDPLGSLDQRSSQLASKIMDHWNDTSDIYIVAHSMGGLDARRVIARYSVGKRIKKLVSIATPHFGSPVADAIVGKDSFLLNLMPESIRKTLEKSTGALNDLTTRENLQDVDKDWVQYHNIACTIKNDGFLKNSQFFALSQAIGKLSGPNDGVVTYTSATRGNDPFAVWDNFDHGDAIGWSSGYFGLEIITNAIHLSNSHLEKYKEIAEKIKLG